MSKDTKNINTEGWGIVNRGILRSELSKNAKLIYSLLSSYQGNKKECFPSLSTIEHDLRMRKKSMLIAIKELEEAKIMKIHRNPGRVNIYELLTYKDTSGEPEPGINDIGNNQGQNDTGGGIKTTPGGWQTGTRGSGKPEPRILTLNNNIKYLTFKRNKDSEKIFSIEEEKEFKMCVCEEMFKDSTFVDFCLREINLTSEGLSKKITEYINQCDIEDLNGKNVQEFNQPFIDWIKEKHTQTNRK